MDVKMETLPTDSKSSVHYPSRLDTRDPTPVQLETISLNGVIIHSLINFPNQLALQLIKIVYNIMMINFLERVEYLKYHTLE